ncbi:hypothetical protein H2O64_09935 [Kordia sp. YSTF-M3]|uniref:Uncharacterized protein n=1 Tax=Kordia aestuariivivens TaxID=2759037 RepID=A0ABR7Q8W4_9FLAO|nr:hypothetical protein [Kordia aestuariivivens]MBC8754991.1 hypothetical protein [Kordia aestuariivivens]
MLKDILNVNGTEKLSKIAQTSLQGGRGGNGCYRKSVAPPRPCLPGYAASNELCCPVSFS